VKILFALLLLAAAHAAGSMTEDQGAQELQKELNGLNKQAEDVLQQIDKLQVLPVPGQPGAALPQMPSMANLPVSGEQMNAVKERVYKIANDDRFMKAAEAVWKSPDRQKLLLIQLGFFLFMILFKAFLQSRTQHWFKKMLVGLMCTIITWVGLSYLIPIAVLGEPFFVVTSTLFKVLVLGQ
jgi:hypothetical protein